MSEKIREHPFSKYWRIYGGWSELFSSKYLRAAVVLTLVLYPEWSTPGWWHDVLAIIPNLLGFSLGGYAMWLAMGDENFRALISGENEDGDPSPYMDVNATFVHFIVLQIAALLVALLAKAYFFHVDYSHPMVDLWYEWLGIFLPVISFFSYLLFIYAILSALAATLALLRTAGWYDTAQTIIKKKARETSGSTTNNSPSQSDSAR